MRRLPMHLKTKWASLSAPYKKRLLQAFGAYLGFCLILGIWIYAGSEKSVHDWNTRIPSVTLDIRRSYQGTPDIGQEEKYGGQETAAHTDNQGKIVLIMTDLGLSDQNTERAIHDLPPEIALAFSPYGEGIANWIKTSEKARRDVLVLLPMDSGSGSAFDPGPKALLTEMAEKENLKRLDAILREAAGVDAVMNFMGDKFMSDSASLTPIFADLRKRGLFFVENPAGLGTKAQEAAEKTSLYTAQADMVIDNEASEKNIRNNLIRLEKLARQRGHAVAIAQPYPITFSMISDWSRNLDSRGVELVRLTDISKPDEEK